MSAFIISGSRRITDHALVALAIDDAITQFGVHPTLIIEGGQRTYDENNWPVGGVDYLAQLWAIRHKVPFHTEHADWPRHRAKAGPIRNRRMAELGQYVVAIPDPDSRGTIDMIEAARKAGFPSGRIYIHYDPELFPEGPTGCLDDGDALGLALRKMQQTGVDHA